MQNFITWLYNLWEQIPAGVRAGVSLLVMGVIATGMAFGWHWPSSWADVQAQVAAFWLVLVPVVVGIFQKSIWPPLFAWILSLLGLAAFVGNAGPLGSGRVVRTLKPGSRF